MCAQFDLKILANELSLAFGFSISEDLQLSKRVLPHSQAAVVVSQEKSCQLKEMKYSLLPSWSKEPKIKFATHNARIETIDEKPTWKIPFVRNHCIVPMGDFIESVYEGDYAGHVISFSDTEDQTLFAAGLYDSWLNKETGEVIDSFAIITTTPSEFILKNGHDRSPLFLSAKDSLEWLFLKNKAAREQKDFLLAKHLNLSLKVKVERPLKAGWEKRK